jgi:type I restriction enzyme R subunit
MSELKISEAGSVQFPMVAHAAAIGWTTIPPKVALQKRGGEAGMQKPTSPPPGSRGPGR